MGKKTILGCSLFVMCVLCMLLFNETVYIKAETNLNITWSMMSKKELSEKVFSVSMKEAGEFFYSLTREELELVIEKVPAFSEIYHEYVLEENLAADIEGYKIAKSSQKPFYKAAMEAYKADRLNAVKTWYYGDNNSNTKTGYWYLRITGNGNITRIKVSVTLNSLNVVPESQAARITKVSLTVMSDSNAHQVRLSDSINYEESVVRFKKSGTDDYSIMQFNFLYNKPAHYHAERDMDYTSGITNDIKYANMREAYNKADKQQIKRINFREYSTENDGTDTADAGGHYGTVETASTSTQTAEVVACISAQYAGWAASTTSVRMHGTLALRLYRNRDILYYLPGGGSYNGSFGNTSTEQGHDYCLCTTSVGQAVPPDIQLNKQGLTNADAVTNPIVSFVGWEQTSGNANGVLTSKGDGSCTYLHCTGNTNGNTRINIKARYKTTLPVAEKKYTICFDYNDGENEDKEVVSSAVFNGWGMNQQDLYKGELNGKSAAGLFDQAVEGKLVLLPCFGKQSTVELPLVKRKGYRLLGWKDKNSGIVYNPGIIYTPNEDRTYVAQWEYTGYRIYYRSNGGSGTMKSQVCSYGETECLSKNQFKRDGFRFLGWTIGKGKELSADTEVDLVDGADIYNLTVSGGRVYLYAFWNHIPEISLKKTLDFYEGDSIPLKTLLSYVEVHDEEEELQKNLVVKWITYKNNGKTVYNPQNLITNDATEYEIAYSVADSRGDSDTKIFQGTVKGNYYYIQFYGNNSTSGEMDKQRVHYNTLVRLNKNKYKRTDVDYKKGSSKMFNKAYNYDFLGWTEHYPCGLSKETKWSYNDAQWVKGLGKYDTVVQLHAFWNAVPNIAPIEDDIAFCFYEGAEINTKMLLSLVKAYDREEGDLTEKVRLHTIYYKKDNQLIMNPTALKTDTPQEIELNFSVKDSRGTEGIWKVDGEVLFNQKPVLYDWYTLDEYTTGIVQNRCYSKSEIEIFLQRLQLAEDISDAEKVQAEKEIVEELCKKIVVKDVEDEAYEQEKENPMYWGGKDAVWQLKDNIEVVLKELCDEKHNWENILTLRTEYFYIDRFGKKNEVYSYISVIEESECIDLSQNCKECYTRTISEDYLNTLSEKSVWKIQDDYRQRLSESLERTEKQAEYVFIFEKSDAEVIRDSVEQYFKSDNKSEGRKLFDETLEKVLERICCKSKDGYDFTCVHPTEHYDENSVITNIDEIGLIKR